MNLSETELAALVQVLNKRSMFRTKNDLMLIQSVLADIQFFVDLRKQIGDGQFLQIMKELQYECQEELQPSVFMGDPSLKFYFIIKGKLLVLSKSNSGNQDLYIENSLKQTLQKRFSDLQPQNFLYSGQYFGEQVLMFDQSHTSTILPVELSHLLIIRRDAYRRIVDNQSSKDNAEKFAFLSGVQLFLRWSAKTLRALLPEINEVSFIGNQFVFQQGDLVEAVYIIIQGEVQLLKSSQRTLIPVALLGVRESFGDDDILNQFRNHSAKTIGNVRLYRILKHKFLDHIPFDYQTLDYKEYQKIQLSPTRKFSTFLKPIIKTRSESMVMLASGMQRSNINKSQFNVTQLLRSNKFKRLSNETFTSSKQAMSQNSIKMTFSPQQPQPRYEEYQSVNNRIHSQKFDKTSYLLGQAKLRRRNILL